MEFFESSGSWTVALGKTLVHSFWIGLLLLSILKICLHSIPDRFSNTRYRMATVTLFIFVTAVVSFFLVLYAPAPLQPSENTASFNIRGVIPYISEFTSKRSGSPVVFICILSSYIYLSGVLFMLLRSLLSFKQIRAVKINGAPIKGEWYQRFLQIKNSIGIIKNVGFLESNKISAPAIVGLFKPAVLVPAGMFTHLSMDQVETILMHELYHLRRLDFLVNMIQLMMESLFFYNPAVWSISQLIRTERENCCDDRVLQSTRDPVIYARALFQLAEHHHTINKLVPGALGTNQNQLFNRINRILNQATMKKNIREKLFSLLLMAGSMLILLTISGFSSAFSLVRHNESKQEGNTLTVTSHPTTTLFAIEVPVSVLDTIPVSEPDAPDKLERIEIEREIEAAKMEVVKELEKIDWEELKKEMELAKQEALESIDWEQLKIEMSRTRIHVDSIMQDFDFDFDFDFDLDGFRIEIEESMKELEEVNWEEIRMEMENVRIHLDSVLHNLDFDMDMKDEIKTLGKSI